MTQAQSPADRVREALRCARGEGPQRLCGARDKGVLTAMGNTRSVEGAAGFLAATTPIHASRDLRHS